MTEGSRAAAIEALRRKLSSLPAGAAWTPGNVPTIEEIFTPRSHRNILDLSRSLVVGSRGVGKTFWSHTLWTRSGRDFAASAYGLPQLHTVEAVFGFKGAIADDTAPSAGVLSQALSKVDVPLIVWQATLLRSYRSTLNADLPDDLVELSVWVANHREEADRRIRAADEERLVSGRPLLVLFDALDTLADNWDEIRQRTGGLLRLALLVKSLSATHVKIFMRPDQFADTALFRFPDASKLRAERVELRWSFLDLYALLLFFIWRSSESREALEEYMRSRRELFPPSGALALTAPARFESVQQNVFSALAGTWMGSNKKRGATYSWVVQHLADARGETTPRGFLTALRSAATYEPHPSDLVIDYRGLLHGVAEASENRVDDLKQDYWWIDYAKEPLAGLETPIDKQTLLNAWKLDRTAELIKRAAPHRGPVPSYLALRDHIAELPKELSSQIETDEDAILSSMRLIGVTEQRSTGKINVPDIFRVAFKMKRRGGVPPRRVQND